MYDVDMEYAFQILLIATLFYQHFRLDKLLSELSDDVTLSPEDIAEVEQTALGHVFDDTRNYYFGGHYTRSGKYRSVCDVYVLRDPLLTRYSALCREYERIKGITKVENRFARGLDDAIQQFMQLPSYCYDYRWCDGTQSKKEPKLVILLDEEFGVYCALIDALFDILDYCEDDIPLLEAELAELKRGMIIPLPVQAAEQLKEAA